MDIAASAAAPTRGKGPRIYQKHSHRDAKGWKKNVDDVPRFCIISFGQRVLLGGLNWKDRRRSARLNVSSIQSPPSPPEMLERLTIKLKLKVYP